MKFSLRVLIFCACAVIFSSAAFAAEDATVECSGGRTPQWLNSPSARQSMVDLINKIFKCIEKSISKYASIGANLIKDFTSCVSKFPTDFFSCLSKLNVPQKISEMVNEFLSTVKCVT